MTKIINIKILVFFCFLGICRASEKPNIILIITDDQGYGDIAAHGNTMIKTPNMDKLHNESIRLTNFHVDPTCALTRAALMTGKYASRTGVWDVVKGRSIVARDETMLPALLAQTGYATGMFGKWHLGDNFPFRPEDRGFHHTIRHAGGAVSSSADYWGNDNFDDTYWMNGTPTKFKGYSTDIWFNAAINFMDEHKDRPFFLYIATNAPHSPYTVEDKYAAPYANKNVSSPMAEFYGMIENIDENMGRLEAKLTALGLRENTIVIFMTDNGTAAGVPWPGYDLPKNSWPGFSAGMRGKKFSQYDGGHRVPFFMRWPAGKLGNPRDISALTAHIDILPTLAEIIDINVPFTLDIDGKSLMPLLQNHGHWSDRTLIVHNQAFQDTPKQWRKSSVMTQRWRLIDGKELYDISIDPAQKNNIAKNYPKIVHKLRNYYKQWWDHIDDRFHTDIAIPIGAAENPTRITAYDWRPHIPYQGMGKRHDQVWSRAVIQQNPETNGYWLVDITQAGEYEIELFQWDKPANKILDAVTAQIQIGDVTTSTKVLPGVTSVKMRMKLPKGEIKMQSQLQAKNGATRGAFYIYIRRL